ELVPRAALERVLLLGELSLDGGLRRVSGGLPVAMYARSAGYRAVVLPRACASEAAALTDVPVLAAGSLPEVASWLRGDLQLQRVAEAPDNSSDLDELDLADVR